MASTLRAEPNPQENQDLIKSYSLTLSKCQKLMASQNYQDAKSGLAEILQSCQAMDQAPVESRFIQQVLTLFADAQRQTGQFVECSTSITAISREQLLVLAMYEPLANFPESIGVIDK